MEFVCGPIFGRSSEGVLQKGAVVEGHEHNFDHATLILSGRMRVRAVFPDGKKMDKEYGAREFVSILAGVAHELTALMDGTEYLCLYTHRDPHTKMVVEKFCGYTDATI